MFQCAWSHYRPKRTSVNHSEKFCVLRMPEFNSRDRKIALSPSICPTRVLRRFQDMCTSKKCQACTNLLSRLGYSMIESVEKLNGRQFCPAKVGTGSNIRSSRAFLLPVNLQPVMAAPTPRGLGGQQLGRGEQGWTPSKGIPACRRGGGRRRRGQRRCEAARQAALATARARELELEHPAPLPDQAAVRARLLKMDAPCLRNMCSTILPNNRPPPDGLQLAGRPKQ